MVAPTIVYHFDDAAAILRALAHPVRMAVVDLLLKNERANVSEIQEALELDQAIASHHLKIMRDHDLVTAEREGRNTYYRLANPAISDLLGMARKLAPGD